MSESLQTALDGLQRFADRHIRLFAILVAALAVPVGLAWLTPLGLQAMVRPLDQMPDRGAGPATFTFLDADGRVIGRRGPVAGEALRLEDMPAYVPAAFMAMEDRRFYRHHGLDLLGLARAAYTDVRARQVVAGGSSISQQTAKLVFDRRERTFHRKLRELVNTARLEKSFNKRQILELYLNRLYLGGGAYGVDTAARTYFGVSARNVSLAQAAMLAALTRAPSVFSPRRDLAAAQARATRVLSAMAEMGAIRPDQAVEASAHPATIVARPVDTHSYFLDAATEEAKKLAGASGPGALIVHTTLNSQLQAAADHVGSDAVSRLGRKLNFSQVAMVAMTPDGAVGAMVGGVSYAHSVFNRALQAHRQPGSAFKPFVYLAALEAGISPWDWRDDRAVDIAGYQPANYKDAHYGRLRLIDALARSVNTITVNLAQEVGIARVAAAARRMGITSPLRNYASLALGTNEVTPMELTAAYGGLARGETVKPYLVSRIETADGKVLFERNDAPGQPVMADTVRRDLTAMLFHVVTSGTGTAARLPDREAAGKTGTTQDYRDAWFVGFTGDYVASVWVGNDDNRPMRKVTGGLVPAQLWKDVMRVAEADLPARPLDRSPEPTGITDDFAAEQVAYVDEVDAAAPQIPMDEQGGVLAGSGLSSDHLARNDDVAAPAATPRAPAMSASAPLPQQTDMPRQEEANRIASQQNYLPRPSVQQTHDARRPPEDTFYGALPDQMRQAQMRQEQMHEEEPRQQPPREQPSYYRPWQPVRPTPYQTYLDQPTREAQGYPDQRGYDPPPYEPRAYYRTPYEDPRAR
jgi:penicillin-binding protein 1A